MVVVVVVTEVLVLRSVHAVVVRLEKEKRDKISLCKSSLRLHLINCMEVGTNRHKTLPTLSLPRPISATKLDEISLLTGRGREVRGEVRRAPAWEI